MKKFCSAHGEFLSQGMQEISLITSRLEAIGIPYCLVGGIAIQKEWQAVLEPK